MLSCRLHGLKEKVQEHMSTLHGFKIRIQDGDMDGWGGGGKGRGKGGVVEE